jgi:hypothetical protein
MMITMMLMIIMMASRAHHSWKRSMERDISSTGMMMSCTTCLYTTSRRICGVIVSLMNDT